MKIDFVEFSTVLYDVAPKRGAPHKSGGSIRISSQNINKQRFNKASIPNAVHSGTEFEYMQRGSLTIVSGVCLSIAVLSSCTWRSAGCLVGGFSAGAAAGVMIESYEAAAKMEATKHRRSYHPLSSAEKAAIIAVAETFGCMAGEKLGEWTDEAIEKQREEYRKEAADLQAQIDHMNDTIADADREIARLNNGVNELKEQKKKIKQLPALKGEMTNRLKTEKARREKASQQLETYLVASKSDTQTAVRSAKDDKEKAQLEQQIKELDSRIAQVRSVRDDLMSIDATVIY